MMMSAKQIFSVFIIILGLPLQAWCGNDFANPDLYKKDRVIYQQAMNALTNKNFGQYQVLRTHLNHYPLASYLDYEYLRRSFDTLPVADIKAFLDKHEGYFAAKRLRIEWLGYLAKHAEWPLYKEFYAANLGSEVLDCYNLQAELVLHTNDKPVYKKIGEFWLKPSIINTACDNVFTQWQRHGHKTQDMIWKRYQRALLAKNMGLAQFLHAQLNTENTKLAKMLQNPVANTEFWVTLLARDKDDIHLESATKKHILNSISHSNVDKTAYVLEKNSIVMTKTDLMEVQRLVAWYYAKTSGEKAVRWIQKHTDFRDVTFVDPLLRYSLQDKNWPLYKEIFKSLPAVFKNQEEWLYWYVITQEELGYEDSDPALQPKNLLAKLSQAQSFYGLLAAQKNNSPVFPNTQFTPQPVVISSDVMKKMGACIELYHRGETTLSNNDWYYTTSQFTEDEWRQAGIIAYRMGWINRTIQAFGRAKFWVAGEERFPILFREDFWSNAKRQGVDPGWILAVARQESAFSPIARSPVGAMGVLQLMPATAKKVAHKMGMPYSDQKLLVPGYNIALGTKYLKEQLNNYNNNYILATAAYNAGPGKVREWLNLRPITDDWAHWVATIPYKETRGYVQNIMTFSKVYNMKLNYKAMAKNESGSVKKDAI